MEVREIPPPVSAADVVPSTLACHQSEVGLDYYVVVVLYGSILLE